MSSLSSSEGLRLAAFCGVLIVMLVWELLLPRRTSNIKRTARWPSNLAVVVLDTVLVRLVFPTTTIAVALLAETNGWGLFNVVRLPQWLTLLAGIVLLDLAIYLQHVLFHWLPALWRFHRMHHADLEFDVTTGVRFHPVEILLSMAIKLGVILALGTPALAVLGFEILLSATSLFNHGNVKLPERLDRTLRWVLVTPDMHRVHHSIVTRETNSNFGFNLPWWDWLFKTYRDQPAAGHLAMTIGLEQFRELTEQRLDRMLTQPFRTGGHDPGQRQAAE
jgi:sterol desaturase/sphingolipid hydroxylase (fatty acid hydroxylase superfamily)